MVQPTISPSERDLLREVMPDEAAELERREKRAADADLPRPALEDILEAQAALEAEWREWRFGTASTSGDEADADTAANLPADGIPGVHRIRAMRYHRDQMPAKWRRLLNGRTRFRSNLTSNEITRTVALATRNVPRVKVPADSDDPDAQAASENESRWAQALLPALERQASKPLLRMHADGIFESGLAFFEVYLTGAYDDLDLDQHDDEEEDSYARRTDEDMLRATKRRGLPVCVRVPDPLSVLYDDDDEGVYVATITERKSYRQVYSQLRRTLGAQKVEELRLPKPGKGAVLPQDYGMPGDSAQGDVTCIRYYDRRWYAYIVSGQIVDGPTEHGMPGVPVIVAWGDTTSSGRRAEQIQGVTWGMVEQEQALNDYMTTRLDIEQTFGRPQPVIQRDKDAPDVDAPGVVDLSQPGVAPRLARGESVVDAYGQFRDRFGGDLMGTMLSLRSQSALNPVAAGESPGSDPSGFAINSLQAAGQMRYEILLDNYGRAIGMLIDFVRRMVKEGPISDRVFVPVETPKGVREYLGLGPDEISDMPCEVVIDPMNDVNRLAIRSSLIAGHQGGYITKRVVQQQGFGVDNVRAMDNELAEELAESQLIALAMEEAKMRVLQTQMQPSPSGLVDQHGNPLQSGQQQPAQPGAGGPGAPSAEDGSEAAPPRPASVGRELSAASARGRGGQQPAQQGVPSGVPRGSV